VVEGAASPPHGRGAARARATCPRPGSPACGARTPPPAGPGPNPRRWRRVEYDRLVELGMFTGERLELLNGLLVVREPQGSSHAAIVSQVARVLERAFGPGWYARQHAPLALDDDSEPEPDV